MAESERLQKMRAIYESNGLALVCGDHSSILEILDEELTILETKLTEAIKYATYKGDS